MKIEPRRPEEYVSRVLAKLSSRLQPLESTAQQALVTARTQELHGLAVEILGRIPEDLKAGHRPCALAATAIYAAEVVLAAQQGRARIVTQRDVAECGDTAEYTVREQYREIICRAIPRPGLIQTPSVRLAR